MRTAGLVVIFICCHYQCVASKSFRTTLDEAVDGITVKIENAYDFVKHSFMDFFVGGQPKRRYFNKANKSSVNLPNSKLYSIYEKKMANDYLRKLRLMPGALLPTPLLAARHGHRVESHIVATEDGYLLVLHRFSKSLYNIIEETDKTVLLHHGILGSSADWILLGSENSLPYILLNKGYDVWLANARGNRYSAGHLSKLTMSKDFWNFTWQDIGFYDLAATVKFIRQYKNSTNPINYIGHSLGATALLVLLSRRPEYNIYFNLAVFLAPLAFMTKVRGPLLSFSSYSFNPDGQLLNILGPGEFMPSKVVPRYIATRNCKGPQIYSRNPLLCFSGSIPDIGVWSDNFTALVMYHVPARTSTKTIFHYAQLINSGKFHSYGNSSDEFDLASISIPVAMFSAPTDWIAPTLDVLKLFIEIPKPIEHIVIEQNQWKHTDFVWGLKAKDLIFDKIIKIFENDISYSAKKFVVNDTDY